MTKYGEGVTGCGQRFVFVKTGTSENNEGLTLVVLDATWQRTRKMLRYLSDELLLDIPHIKLSPTALSVYSRTQSQQDRICTVEAIALLLAELGEPSDVTDALVEYVRMNNEALTSYVPGNVGSKDTHD
eukprot:RCo055202